ncbi:hypothetical protein FA95DRAFT_986223 [Auriscalpium vulgare]|uniref:Uncharacterized protein n=1 Tax=Auriscalpium vulgare TaxID=40419 RepID=A0ACB8RXI1_9AGAM|nr:hypothetical protein FA95DRAFT_986223 [Auriscalpium vulgare]
MATSSSAAVPVGAPPPMRTLYKVHKSTMARFCDTFASLFDGPQAALAAGSECRDGSLQCLAAKRCSDSGYRTFCGLPRPGTGPKKCTLKSKSRSTCKATLSAGKTYRGSHRLASLAPCGLRSYRQSTNLSELPQAHEQSTLSERQSLWEWLPVVFGTHAEDSDWGQALEVIHADDVES